MADLNTSDHKAERGGKSNIAAKFQYALTPDSLPPIGVFWDIENCQVPKGRSATILVQVLRERFLKGHREAEFMCVCDISKERKEIISELNDAQVTVVHIIATSKNAADDKLKQCMRRFVDIHGCPSTVVLISSDINFTTDLSDFRYRRKIRVILIHGDHAPEPLLACADEHCRFEELTAALPYRSPAKGQIIQRSCEILVADIPTNRDVKQIQNRLRRLSDNCGGKVVTIQGSTAVIRFANPEAAMRAHKRMDKEDVFGNKISVFYGRHQEPRDGSPVNYLISRSCHSSNCGGSSRECSPVLTDSHIFDQRQRSYSETACSQDYFDVPPPPPDLIRQDKACRLSHNTQSSYNIKENCDNVQSEELKTIITHIEKANSSRETSPFPLLDKGKAVPKNVGRVSPFLMSGSGPRTNMNSPRCSASKFQLFPSDSQSMGFNFSLPVRSAGNVPNVGFSPIHRTSQMTPSPPPPPLYTWNSASLAAQDPFRTVRNVSPAVPLSYPGSVTINPVELLVTNLDQHVDANEMKKILFAAFREHVMVLHVSMLLQPDGTLKAIVKVPSAQDAQLAISQLHRKKIGFKRILISYTSNDRVPPLHILKCEVTTLLNDVPNNKIPLFKFRELFENRYHRSIGTSDLYKLKDVVHVTDEKSGRMVCFNPNYRATPSPVAFDGSEMDGLEKDYCEHHTSHPQVQGWAESDSVEPLPDVTISLKSLSSKVHTLLDSHQGSLPLNSFCSCYEAEFGSLKASSTSTTEASSGVPLEHLIACIPGVQITKLPTGVKKVQWLGNKDTQNLDAVTGTEKIGNRAGEFSVDEKHVPERQKRKLPFGQPKFKRACWQGPAANRNQAAEHQQGTSNQREQGGRCISPSLMGQVSLFSREMVDLLKNQPHCTIPFHKFIPLYHHHFGRQCRVSDYGYTRLIDLLEAIPHVVQILGQGQNRALTLSHRSQMKRFASDLLRILKARASKQLSISEMPQVYEECIGKPFNVAHYGICTLEDLIGELSENTVVITHTGTDIIVSIPKREQTSEEMERTRAFSQEVIEILSHTPTCSMLFNKFVPAYHHHFGKQCKVSDFGFSKLIELFEAIPDVIEILGSGEEKVIKLTNKEKLAVLGDRIVALVCSAGGSQQFVPMEAILSSYLKVHGHKLYLQDFGLSNVEDMAEQLKNCVKVQEKGKKQGLTLVDQTSLQKTSLQLRCILMEQPQGFMSITALKQMYLTRYSLPLDLCILSHCFENIIKVENDVVRLTPLQLMFRNILQLLQENDGQIAMSNMESIFLNRFGVTCQPALYGFQSFTTMLSSAPEFFTWKSKKKRTLTYNSNNTDTIPLLTSREFQVHTSTEQKPNIFPVIKSELELMMRASPFDLMSQPVPSSVPSPELEPEHKPLKNRDLMGFESPMPMANDIITGNSVPEQANLPYSSMLFGPPSGHPLQSMLYQQFPFNLMQPPAAWLSSPATQTTFPVTNNMYSEHDAKPGESIDSLSGSGMSSAQDTPTRRSRRSRIAAHFSVHP